MIVLILRKKIKYQLSMRAMGLPEGFALPSREVLHYDNYNYSYKENDIPKLKDRNKNRSKQSIFL